jgi:hypothetical protein
MTGLIVTLSAIGTPTVLVDPAKSPQSWHFSEQCGRPAMDDRDHWRGTITAVRLR